MPKDEFVWLIVHDHCHRKKSAKRMASICRANCGAKYDSSGSVCGVALQKGEEAADRRALFRTYSPTPGGCGNVLVALGLANNLYVSEEGSARVSSGVSGYSERLLAKAEGCCPKLGGLCA